MTNRNRQFHARLLGGAAAIAIVASSGAAYAADAKFDIAPQPLDSALREFGVQSGVTILADAELTLSKVSPGIVATSDPDTALRQVLAGTGLSYKRDGDVFVISRFAQQGEGGSNPQGVSGGGAAEVEALIVTAQKREEDIQDVPIAISAFSARDLDAQKIEGGFDLLKAIPNVTFTKTNFTGYNFQIRGVGTQAISATTDPGVAVAFNSNGLIHNRLFEQEYLDVERVEVLRGPQGTLYGRNATGGVINVITAKPRLSEFFGEVKLEGGNFDTKRIKGMVNVPLVEDVLGIRLAGSWTQREGYDFNETTGNAVNGRDLWTSRLSVGFEPHPAIRANLIWEHFEEDDNRSRTSKQLCHRDPGPEMIGDVDLVNNPTISDRLEGNGLIFARAMFAQGCLPGSLYEPAAFGTVNGLSLPFIFAETYLHNILVGGVGIDPETGENVSLLRVEDPYGGRMQSPDLRTIASVVDPVYRAKADLLELSFEADITDGLTFISQTIYNEDSVYSFQDFNRFNTDPIFRDTEELIGGTDKFGNPEPNRYADLAPGGVFCDPQIGCSDRVVGLDISQAKSRQFSQEFRLQSNFDGPVNFSAGMNHTRFETVNDYYVFYNVLTVLAMTTPLNNIRFEDVTLDPRVWCHEGGYVPGDVPGPILSSNPLAKCPYIDPQPLDTSTNFEGDGHNYFRSKNPYELRSTAVFGELYWEVAEDWKLTTGLRYTRDTKTFTPVPSQVLLANGTAAGTTSIGYPELPDIEQNWGEFTGRLVLDWSPVLIFTDETMVYGSFARGYKGGGANPPTPGFATREDVARALAQFGHQTSAVEPIVQLNAVEYGRTFEPEFVNAFEVGTKNTVLGGAATLNATAFYYDYTDYQVSQIRDRTAVNENFDTTMWGLELEGRWTPIRSLTLNANVGYLKTKIADGESSIDLMDRTAGNPDYIVVKPWMQLPSNCVVPVEVVEANIENFLVMQPLRYARFCGGVGTDSILGFLSAAGNLVDWDEYPELNGGAGIRKDLGGNDLPNSPRWTVNVGAQYTLAAPGGWDVTGRVDYYWQDQSYHRVYNFEPYDRLQAWSNTNLSLWATNEAWGVTAEVYVKNVFDEDQITGAFLNSDDTGLTTNVFTLDPRLVGVSVRKTF